VIVEGQEPWHVGVVGIVASRVLQQFYRPTIILGGDGSQWRGSGRSIAGFDLAAALRDCAELLIRQGGHAMAAGLSMESANLEKFRARLNSLARAKLPPDALQASLRLDAQVGLEEMTYACVNALERLRPTGQGNPPLHFFASKVRHQRPLQRVGSDKQHVKMWVTDGNIIQEAIWWGAGEESLPVGCFDLAFSPQLAEYEGLIRVQLRVLDWKPA
jgi:single-stranded-DNA-specific exonuclease